MSLEKILAKIKDDAQREADRIKGQAEAKASRIIDDAKKQAEDKKKELIDEAKESASQHKERKVSMAALDFRKEILEEKQKAIDLAFEKAREQLLSLSEQKYLELLEDLILDSAEVGDEELILSPEDQKKLYQGFIESLNVKLNAAGKKGNLTISEETRNISGGVILRRGKIEVNSSFESLLDASRDELEADVSKLLLSNF
jgi:V/A-type H+-transporting ATPase subunit E